MSRTAYVILGMLKLGRRTGYDIKALVDVSTRYFWAASYGQIYPELARLERARLVEGSPDPSNGRRRKTYELTPAGEQALHDWLTSDEPLHVELRHEGALKLFFAEALSPTEQREQIRRLRAHHEGVLEQLRGIAPGARASGEDGQSCGYVVLEWGIAYQEFFVDWCERLERRLVEEQTLATEGS